MSTPSPPTPGHHMALPIPEPSGIWASSSQSSQKRRRSSESVPFLSKRQDWGSEFPPCDNVGNDVLSCWPISNTTLLQGQFSRFIWNARFPPFIGSGDVDIYLNHADSDLLVRKWTEHNAKGWIPLEVNDEWFGQRGYDWRPGQNQTFPYYFLIVKSGEQLTGGEPRQSQFIALQTGPLQAVLSASSASASSASASSANPASSNPALQNSTNNGGNSLPSWAIALLVILGVLFLVALLLFSYLLLRKMRADKRKNVRLQRSSVGSESPMMAAVNQHPTSPSVRAETVRGSYPSGPPVLPAPSVRHHQYPMHDGASTTSRANSAGEGLISNADAAIMANAFRNILRQPDFVDQPLEEGDTPPEDTDHHHPHPEEQLLNRELAEEGRDLRSVSSERGVRVQTQPERTSTS